MNCLLAASRAACCVLLILTSPCLADSSPGTDEIRVAAVAVFRRPTADAPNALAAGEPLDKGAAEAARTALWQWYQEAELPDGKDFKLPKPTVIGKSRQIQLRPGQLTTGEKTMPFVFVQRGEAAADKKLPLFIALHGGGGAKVGGPHAWPVNTREWQTQAQLACTIYPDNAMYFVPRMADDRDGRWYYGYCQDAYDKVIRSAIRDHNADPNRVYLIGISEGAYTAYRLGAFMADRWAGSGSMAGGEPLNNAPPANMRNLAFRADIGEKDTMFDRIGLNRRYGEALTKLKQEDADGFEHMIHVHQGRGHGIDYRPCPKWLLQYQRNPIPQRVRWVNIDVHKRRRMQSYWLALNEAPEGRVEFDASIDSEQNTINVDVFRLAKDNRTAENGVAFQVFLNDSMLDLEQPVRIVRNGETVFNGKVKRSWANLAKTLAQRGDVNYCFPVTIDVPASP